MIYLVILIGNIYRGAPDIISGRISGPDSEIIELSGIRPDISNIRPDTGYFFKAY
jgi:hypothetical protein